MSTDDKPEDQKPEDQKPDDQKPDEQKTEDAKTPRPSGKKRAVSRVSTIGPRPGQAGASRARPGGAGRDRRVSASELSSRPKTTATRPRPVRGVTTRKPVGSLIGPKLLVILAIATLIFTGIAVLAYFKPGTTTPSNTAFVDDKATSAVVSDGTAGLKQFFAIDYANLDGWAEKTKTNFTGPALKNFETTYAPQAQAQIKQQLGGDLQGKVDCTIDVFGVEAINGDLAKADASVVLSSEGQALQSGTVKVSLGLKKVDGRWKISEFTPL